jgi:hypothetical protein
MKTFSKTCTLTIFAALLLMVPLSAAGNGVDNFRAILSGDNEVPPVDTNARGLAKFQLNRNGNELSYKLIVANICDVLAAHIHWAPEGENGPVVVTLFQGPPAGSIDGILAEGTITEEDLVGSLSGAALEDLVVLMQNAQTYVNVHTLAFPPGEIRGQIFSSAQALTASCWGQATAVFAQMGEMGEHASQQPTPRAGLRNLARYLYDEGVISEPTLDSLGAFVAAELGLSIEACE